MYKLEARTHMDLGNTASGLTVSELQTKWTEAMDSSDSLEWCAREVLYTLKWTDRSQSFIAKFSDMFEKLTLYAMKIYSTNDIISVISILTDLSVVSSNLEKLLRQDDGIVALEKRFFYLVREMNTCKKSRVGSQLNVFCKKIEKKFAAQKKQFGCILDTSDEDEDDFVFCRGCNSKIEERVIHEEYATYFSKAIWYLNQCLRAILERNVPLISISLHYAVVDAIKGYVQLNSTSNIPAKKQAFIINTFIRDWSMSTSNYHTIISTHNGRYCPGSDLTNLTHEIVSGLRDPISLRTSFLFILTTTINHLSNYPAPYLEVAEPPPDRDVSLTSPSETKQHFSTTRGIVLTRKRKREAENQWCDDEFICHRHQIPRPADRSFYFKERKRNCLEDVYTISRKRYQTHPKKKQQILKKVFRM